MLHKIIFGIARNVTDIDPIEVDRLEQRAEKQINTWTKQDKGYKGLYAKINEGWIVHLIAIFASPFITAYLLKTKNDLLNPVRSQGFDEEDSEDYDEEEYELLKELQRKYEKI